jgi:hypothetical protein
VKAEAKITESGKDVDWLRVVAAEQWQALHEASMYAAKLEETYAEWLAIATKRFAIS